MHGSNLTAEPNLSKLAASNGGSNLVGNMPAMNALDSTFDQGFSTCPVTDTSGSVIRRRDLIAFSLSESVYAKGLKLSKHCHAHAYLSYVLSGSYIEKYANRECICSEG